MVSNLSFWKISIQKIKGKSSKKLPTTHDIPQVQVSVFGTLIFILYINDLNKAIMLSAVHHFADNKNLFYCNKSLKKSCKTRKPWPETPLWVA